MRMPVSKAHGLLNRRIKNKRVGVQDEKVPALPKLHRLVAGGGKTLVLPILYEAHMREFLPDHLGTAILRPVIYDDDLKRSLSGFIVNRSQALAQYIPRIPAWDDDGNVNVFGGYFRHIET